MSTLFLIGLIIAAIAITINMLVHRKGVPGQKTVCGMVAMLLMGCTLILIG